MVYNGAVMAEKQEKKAFAVIETGGKQYVVSEGDTITVEKMSGLGDEGADVSFDKVLLVSDGAEPRIGSPYVSGAVVKGRLIAQGRGKKVTVIRFRPKSRYFKKKGHRQPFMRIEITEITKI